MALGNINERLPIFTRRTPPAKMAKIMATEVFLYTSSALSNFALVQDTTEFPFQGDKPAGAMNAFVAKDVGPMSKWQLKIQDVTTPMDQLWLVVRYALGS